MRSEINRLQQFLKKLKEYQRLIVFQGEEPLSHEELRLDLIKRYEELKELIIAANNGTIPQFALMGTICPIMEGSFSSNSTQAFYCLKEAPSVIVQTIAFYGGKKVKIIPPERGVLSSVSEYIDNVEKILRAKNTKVLQDLVTVNKQIAQNNESGYKAAAQLLRGVIISLSDNLCKFPKGQYFGLDCSKDKEKNRLLAYLFEKGMDQNRAKIIVSTIYNIGSKGKRKANKEQVVYSLILTYMLIIDINNLTEFRALHSCIDCKKLCFDERCAGCIKVLKKQLGPIG